MKQYKIYLNINKTECINKIWANSLNEAYGNLAILKKIGLEDCINLFFIDENE